MNLAFSLRVLADLCYYVFAISSVATCAGHSGLMLAGPLFGALAAYFVALAGRKAPKKRWLQHLAALLAAGSLFFAHAPADWVVYVPIAVYLQVIVFKRLVYVDYDSTQSRFFLCLKILPAPLVLTLVAGNKAGFLEVMLPYFLFFLVLNVMLLRMLRHNEQVLSDGKFRAMNLMQIGLLCGAGWLLTTGYVVTAFQFLVRQLVRFVLRPLCNLILYAIGGVGWVLNKIFGGIDFHLEDVDLSALDNLGQGMDEGDQAVMEFYEEASKNSETTRVLTYAAIGLAVIVTIVLIIVLFKILMRAARRPEDNKFADERSSLDEKEDAGKRLGFSPRDRVRNYYRKFLKQALKAGLDPDENADSREIVQQMRPRFQPQALDGLREVYIRARYSSQEITSADVKQAKEMYDDLKKKEN